MTLESKRATKMRATTRFFHVTTRERLASLAENGFDPKFSRTGNGLLYLAPDAGHALAYAGHHGDETQAVLLMVKGEDLDPAFLGPDDVDLPDLVGDAWEKCDWLKSVEKSGQCAYSGIVPADRFIAKLCPDGNPEGAWMSLADMASECAATSSPAP